MQQGTVQTDTVTATFLRLDDAETYLSKVWGEQAYINPNHVGGRSLPTYSARANGSHWLPLATKWDGCGEQVVAPVSGVWPGQGEGERTMSGLDNGELDHPSEWYGTLIDIPDDADFEGDPYSDEEGDEPEPVDPYAPILKQFDAQWTEKDMLRCLASLQVPDGVDPETGWFDDSPPPWDERDMKARAAIAKATGQE